MTRHYPDLGSAFDGLQQIPKRQLRLSLTWGKTGRKHRILCEKKFWKTLKRSTYCKWYPKFTFCSLSLFFYFAFVFLFNFDILGTRVHTVFIRLNAAAFIKFFVIRFAAFIRERRFLKSNLFLANNNVVTEHLNFTLNWKTLLQMTVTSKACGLSWIPVFWAWNVPILKHC